MFYGENKKVTVAATSQYLSDVKNIGFDNFGNNCNWQGKKHHS